MDGFDHYAVADFLKKWTAGVPTNISAVYSRTRHGQGMNLANITAKKTRSGAAVDTFIVGFAFLMPTVAGITMLTLADAGAEQCSVRVSAGGNLTFNRGANVLATSTNVLSASTWYYLECKAKVHNSAGTYEVRINGTATNWIPAATGQNTRNGTLNQVTEVWLMSTNGGVPVQFDDVYCADSISPNNDFLGPQMICVLRPAGAGNYAQWTPNFGANFGNVNESYYDADLTFNQSSTANQVDSFVMEDAPISSGTITAIQHVIVAKQDAGAQRVLCAHQRDAGGDHASAVTFNLSTSYQFLLDPKDTDVNTGNAYLLADLNAAEFGYKLIS